MSNRLESSVVSDEDAMFDISSLSFSLDKKFDGNGDGDGNCVSSLTCLELEES